MVAPECGETYFIGMVRASVIVAESADGGHLRRRKPGSAERVVGAPATDDDACHLQLTAA